MFNRECVGMLRRPIGRLGNHFFQFNFLEQIRIQTGFGKFHPPFLGKEIYQGMGATFESRILNVKNFYFYHAKEIEEMSFSDICAKIAYQNTSGVVPIIPPGIMGNKFVESSVVDPKDIFQLKKRKKYNETQAPEEFITSLHFRGTDILEWDSRALLDIDYYLDSVDLANSLEKEKQHKFQIITDDPSHDVVIILSKQLSANVISDKDINDFLRLRDSDLVIGSASTFSLWSSILGNKKIILPKKWIDYKIESNDKYWISLTSTDLPMLEILAIL